jgi:inorganic pyrophosphatase
MLAGSSWTLRSVERSAARQLYAGLHYKDLEPGKWVKLIGWGDAEEARQLIVEAIERARKEREGAE